MLGEPHPSPERRTAIGARVRRRDVPFTPSGGPDRLDPRTLTIALDDLLPAERVVAVDSGDPTGHPSVVRDVADEFGSCSTQASQSVGLGVGGC